MIIKFDGLDGCGKTTLSKAVAERLSKHHTVALLSEFSSPAEYSVRSSVPVPIATLRIREAIFNPDYQFDDVERQLLLHFLSRRKNRIEIPRLGELNDFVIVDRSTLSNYAYAAAIEPKLAALSELASDGIETADIVFWIDTPVEECLNRISTRLLDAVEQKGSAYFQRVRELFQRQASASTIARTLDGRKSVGVLVDEVDSIISAWHGAASPQADVDAT